MSPSQARTVKPSLSLDARIVPDRRRHKRFSLPLLGRFMRASKEEYPCKLLNVSVGGAAIMSPVQVDCGEHIVACIRRAGPPSSK